ncbi:MAG TPA: Rne/Rng family ribonuclease [Bryobacteraceae bacterium]|nr:Rne/Rng family ribonuclease [Bryobacteraceae bacterium]
MSKELVISANRHETKVAILEDDQLVEVFFQRANEYSLAGSIHKGRVTRVLPGMQSAFVDLGLERDTFLYVSDFFEENEDFDRVAVTRESRTAERGRGAPAEARTPEAAAPPAAETATTESAEEISGEAPPEAASAPSRSEEGDGRDRRGRRSRRRRNRGRGFPESKYASEPSRAARAPESAVASEPLPEPARETASGESGEFAVLPGESLAKYRHAAIQPLDDAEEEEIRSLHPDAGAGAESSMQAGAVEDALPEEPDSSAEEMTAIEEESISAVTVQAISSAASESTPAMTLDETSLEAEIEEAEEAEDLQQAAEAAAEAAAESAGSDEEEPAPAAASEEPSEGAAQEGQPSASQPQTAQLREQGGRYMHRMPRRMRRKMRGGTFADARPESGRRGEATAAPSSEPALSRSETSRTVARPERPPQASITELLKEGQEIIVQIAKEPLGQKGARITSHIALPGRYVVYMPTVEHTGVSRKIASDEERLRLKRILQIHAAGIPGGFIVRTAGEGKSEDELAADMTFLFNLWLDIRQKAEKSPAPVLLHHDLDIVQRTLRDQVTHDFKAVWVDNEEMYESVVRFVQRFQPVLVNRVKLYTRSEPIFDTFNITAELEKALRPKVWLKSGGHIVINQTEALVAIDVNTGKYVGRSNRLEDTIVKTNTEAVKEIVRQIRLRDLGGIIVVDFIDMDERKNRQKVMQTLEDAMRADRAPYKILQFNDFGLVAITRKRVKQSLERALCMPCPHCEGAGYVKSVPTVVSEILQEAHKIAAALDSKDAVLRAHPDVARFLKSNQNKYLEEIEEILHRPVLVKGDPLLHHEKFDLG